MRSMGRAEAACNQQGSSDTMRRDDRRSARTKRRCACSCCAPQLAAARRPARMPMIRAERLQRCWCCKSSVCPARPAAAPRRTLHAFRARRARCVRRRSCFVRLTRLSACCRGKKRFFLVSAKRTLQWDLVPDTPPLLARSLAPQWRLPATGAWRGRAARAASRAMRRRERAIWRWHLGRALTRAARAAAGRAAGSCSWAASPLSRPRVRCGARAREGPCRSA